MSDIVWVIVLIPSKDHELKRLKLPSKCGTIENALQSIGQGSNNQAFSLEETEKIESSKSESLVEILRRSLIELKIIDSCCWTLTKNGQFHQIQFGCNVEHSDEIIQLLFSRGVGSRPETFIGMLPFALTYNNEMISHATNQLKDDKRGNDQQTDTLNKSVDDNQKVSSPTGSKKLNKFQSMQNKFMKSVTARLTVAQVIKNVESGAELTFDFAVYVLTAAFIAAIGLVENSIVCLVASMLVSPMMGPLMALTFGSIIHNKNLKRLGVINMLIGFTATIMFGFALGIFIFSFIKEWNSQMIWPTTEMVARGELRNLFVGALIALPSGVAVALSILGGNQSSLVGVAISASLLPPCVNSGLLWAYCVVKLVRTACYKSFDWMFMNNRGYHNSFDELAPMDGYEWRYSDNMAIESAILGLVSLMLALINIFVIFLMAFLILKMKEVMPMPSFSKSPTNRFWKEDIKIARDYNRSFDSKYRDSLGKDILEEWAQITGIDSRELMSDKPEAQMTQLQTLQDILNDAQEDEVFQTILKESSPRQSIFESIQPTINQRRISLAPKSSLTLDVESGILSRQSISCSPRLDKRRPSHQLKDYIRRLSFNRSEAQCTENIPQPSGLLCAEPNSKQSNLQALQSSLKQSDHQSYSLWPRRQSEVTASSSKLLPTVSSSHSTSRQDRFSVSPVERVPEECVTARPELNQSVDQERSTEKPNESFKF